MVITKARKVIYTTAVLILLGGLSELALRLADPEIFRFVYAARQVHRYGLFTKVDFRPCQSALLRLSRPSDGSALFHFQVEVNALGFRVADRRTWSAGARQKQGPTIVHCLGDSYTMGWGVSATEAFPALLSEILGPAHRVLNLGVDGYGLVAASEKSRRVARVLQPDIVVYLFSPNDPGDDATTLEVQRRASFEHEAWLLLDAARRRSYLANLPFALKWAAYFEPARRAAELATRPEGPPAYPAPEELEARSAEVGALEGPTAQALRSLHGDRGRLGRRLLVVFADAERITLSALRLCREEGWPYLICPVPEHELIPGDRHFAAAGHRRLARAIAARLAR